ncbi:iron-sulfur cluster repair di-iron protein [Litchfieldia salsa]|uniref:Regulator of cell morphogenesis and NO signaling n=1 Tax=Litchfieldia salsa TaxID=930152 RepID=A0A1H0S8D4_9BACI|nr:iron-sulfur cluster repair di-iron protein [Litchfieldia salsa]SDP37927.1 regulator of cell morphogenesis and NO signaling [Litchfieldia salsa]
MSQLFTEQSIIGEIVTEFPKASDLFKTYKIDFCCGGNRPLIDALEERSLAKEEVLDKLNSLYEEAKALNNQDTDWTKATFTQLIDHIVNTHHKFLNEELPLLSPYVTKVLRVHGAEHQHLAEVHSLYNQLKTELEQHTIKEEADAFPLFINFENNPSDYNKEELTKLVTELEDEHDGAGDLIKEIRNITADFTPPPGACGTYRLVYQRLANLESDLFQHIHLENNILFKRAREL